MVSLNSYCTETEAAGIMGYSVEDFRRLMGADHKAPRPCGFMAGSDEQHYVRALIVNYRDARSRR
ncbi:hypothetical protein [Mesorhizobium sp. B1-1-5]|uniref:hypothetical protein n=1 Tax=Mesorhizobium sp. B1-1-5 TaxID=2589979 RepID=UPI00112629B7|nr:hypothetical protein [Mesorhizobium sp. B1-1-5]TPO02194.1 hypothetical protein FJ980_18735 [Mesorhizobium sp. B1-1-5]